MGFLLEPFQHSFRKRLSHKPKFYFFDTGVIRALNRTLQVPLVPGTFAYGNAFEHFVLLEIFRLERYAQLDFRFSYLRTKDGIEIDLVVERPGLPLAFIEITSSLFVDDETIKIMVALLKDFSEPVETMILCQETEPRVVQGISIMPWQMGIESLIPQPVGRIGKPI